MTPRLAAIRRPLSVTEQMDLYATMRRGMQATAELSVAEQKLAERREQLIRDAIAAYNSKVPEKKLTERDAMLFVASLAENQRLFDDLKATEADGHRAAEKLKG